MSEIFYLEMKIINNLVQLRFGRTCLTFQNFQTILLFNVDSSLTVFTHSQTIIVPLVTFSNCSPSD